MAVDFLGRWIVLRSASVLEVFQPKCLQDPAAQRTASQSIVYAYTCFGLAIAILLWRGPDPSLARYAIGLQIGSLLAAAIFCSDFASLGRLRWVQIVALCLLAGLPATRASLASPLDPLRTRAELARTMLECRDRLGLRSGFAHYNQARQLAMATDWAVQVLPFNGQTPQPFFWGGNLLWFYYELATGRPLDANFIISNGFDVAKLEKLYGAASKSLECGPFRILVYEDSQHFTRTAREISSLPSWAYAMVESLPPNATEIKVSDRVSLSPLSFFNTTGQLTAHSASAAGPVDQPGYLALGPGVTLDAGSYIFGFTVNCSDGSHWNRNCWFRPIAWSAAKMPC